MLIDLSKAGITSPHPDVQGILLVINDQFERYPEKFGPPEIRQQLQQDIADYQRQHGPNKTDTKQFHTFFAERLEHYGLTPFADVSLAFLQCHGEIWPRMAPILSLFGSLHHIEQHFSVQSARECIPAPEKVDYMVTGNALNDTEDPQDLILACGSVLKQGGRCIHLLHFGPRNFTPVEELSNIENYTTAGQKLLRNSLKDTSAPPDRIVFPAYGKHILMFEQVREIDLAPSVINNVPAAISGSSELHGRVQPHSPQIENDDTGIV